MIQNTITALKKEIVNNIRYGKYQVKNYEVEGNWERLNVTIEDQDFIIGIIGKTNTVVIHNLETISNMLTKEECAIIALELSEVSTYKIS